MKKGILIGFVVILIAGGGVISYGILNADSLIKDAVEKYGSEATKTKVTLEGVELSIKEGTAKLKGFRMVNPAGFKTEKAMSFGVVNVKIDTDSSTKDVIVIKEVVIDSPDINYEKINGKANFDAIQQNVDAYAKSKGLGGGKKEVKSEKDGTKLIIENLYVRNGKVAVKTDVLLGKKLGAALPTIHLKNIGKKEKGATVGEVTRQIVSAIVGNAANVGKAVVDGAMKALKGVTDGAKKMLEGGADGAGKVLEGTTKSIKGLFGK